MSIINACWLQIPLFFILILFQFKNSQMT